LQKVIAEQVGQHLEARACRKDGTLFNAELSIGYIRDLNEEVDGLVCTLRDVTERKQAERALNAKLDEEREFQQRLKTLHEITINLTQLDDLDEFYKQAVQAGCQRLGFKRFALFLYQDHEAIGTYGTDSQGSLVDEHDVHFTPSGLKMRVYESGDHVAFAESAPLFDRPDGAVWNATAVLRNGANELGWLAVDNRIADQPSARWRLEILALYGLTLGALLARKQTDAALRDSESRLRESQQMLQIILETIPVRVFWKDRNAIFLGANRLFLQDMGLRSADDMIGKGELDHDQPGRAAIYQSDDQAIMESGIPRLYYEEGLILPNGSPIWVQTSKVPLHNVTGEIIGILGAYTDITERKQSEEALRAAFEREKELGELKSRFVAMASHELRTPLASIMSAAELLIHYRDRMDGSQIDEKLTLITRRVDHLASIIEDVLNLGRMQSGHTEYHPVRTDLDALCQDVVAEFQNQPAMTHEVLYRCDQRPILLDLDRKLTCQVITNLISNAIKYSPASQQVSVSLELRHESAVLCVRDSGIGIPAQDVKHLFEPFHRARNVGAISGTGLGLAISKEAVEQHGGTIRVESEVGVGTAVYVHLPIIA
jgi:PAS domain S-box-containing protein